MILLQRLYYQYAREHVISATPFSTVRKSFVSVIKRDFTKMGLHEKITT